ncbi:putative SNF2-family helicase [Actinoplanes missouriensis 431]|uniref:Putative SNF2-family helicase n=1 Tax=Actinoplanes missouriensis (strain ATCC 14538 / DSM 43046 / CBS 188.64 / JCM 3121 / NBRC 102363 / NCIMB 12654 / NRRL B-3342 / UNCC 431) TaxID=512565 RepID=I0HAL4_ACTM4|nr:DEAD/DEAH box helicase [Actinoplanes missouriensis]BAL90051.1 putative SNF2-family helicase [Actinoplanes missouriensis 431]
MTGATAAEQGAGADVVEASVLASVRVLHGFVGRDGGLNLWAEEGSVWPVSRAAAAGAVGGAATGGAVAGRGAGRGAAAWHPFAVAAGELPAGDPREAATVVLPSTSAGPLASPQLGMPRRRGAVRARPWRVPAVSVPFADPDLVAEFEGRVAPSAAWIVELCGFAASLVRRGRVLPAIRIEGARPAAHWRPVTIGADAVRRAALLETMPPACGAETAGGGQRSAAARRGDEGGGGEHGRGEHGGGAAAEELLRVALDRLVDGLVRTRLAEAGVSLADYGWLAALGGEPEFEATPALADELAGRLDAWFEQAARGAEVRVCFRLSDPREHEPVMPADVPLPEDAWRLEFLLQATDEPSVLVPAADVWRDTFAPLSRWTSHPQERLLAGLGRAARLYPALGEALRDARPAEMLLDTEAAHGFLSHAALLAEAGYGVLLPAWWQRRPGLGLSLEVRGRDPVSSVLRDRAVGKKQLVDYQWSLALGGRTLTEHELADLARAKVPLIRLRGRWVHLDPQRLAAGLAFLSRGGGTMTAGDALATMRLLPPEELPLPVTDARGEGWLADLLTGRLEQSLELLDPPEGLGTVLRPYQIRGFSWLAFLDALGLGACLADDMGLGKTVQLLTLLLHHRAGPALLICPLSVLGNWQREAERFAPGLRVRVLHGADRADPRTLADGADLVLTTYQTAVRDADVLAGIDWDRVVLDEAQHIKNSGSAAAKAVRRFPARNRIALTGTPVENRLAELWSILDFLNPGLLASAHTFRARFSVPIERYADEDAAARLRQATRPFLLRRTKNDAMIAAELPAKRHVRHLCGMTTEQVSLYQAVLDDLLGRLEEPGDTWRKGLVLSAMTKLKQVCVHPALALKDNSPLPGRSGKVDRLEEIVDRALGAGESVLCFTQFARFGGMLTPHLAARFGAPVSFLHGGTPRGRRDAMVAAFQQATRPGIFVLSLKAGGTGLNLTAANHVIHIDRWWNPATETQASDRAFRIGQRRDVHVHNLVCLGTLEENIDRVIADKGILADRVVGTGESWLSALSTSELRDLFTLAPEAIVD